MFHGRDGFYMGRTLDYERSFGEQVVVTPRRFPLRFRHGETLEEQGVAEIGLFSVTLLLFSQSTEDATAHTVEEE